MDYAAQEGGDANVRAVFTGQAGKGRVTDTAGVRRLDESTLKSASFDAGELKAMEGNRVTPEAAASHARAQGWDATRFTYAAEADTGKRGGASQAEKRGGYGLPRSLLRSAEHTSEIQSLMRTSYAGFCLEKKYNEDEGKGLV